MATRTRNEPLLIGEVRSETADDGRTVVRADVDRAEVSYASDVELLPSADAFACAFLIPALVSKRRLKSAGAIDETLAGNMQKIADICGDWWGYGPLDLEADTVRRSATGRTAMFFTAGVAAIAPPPPDRALPPSSTHIAPASGGFHRRVAPPE